MKLLSPTQHRRLNEIVGFLLLSLGLVMLLSLVSYHTQDPSFDTAAASRPLNLVGYPGSYLSDLFFQMFGAAAFLFPLLTFLLSWKWIRSDELQAGGVKVFGAVLLTLALSAGLSFAPLRLFAGTIRIGGTLGLTLASYLAVSYTHLLYQVLAIGFGSGLLLVLGSMAYIVRLDRQTRVRYVELARSQRALRKLSARLVDAQETERRAISRELHDEVGQSLGALLVDIGRLSTTLSGGHPEVKAQLDSLKSVAERTFQSVRNIALLLRPSMLDDLGLAAALEWQGREVSRRSEIEVTVESENVPEDLPDEHKIYIYRLVQEALNLSLIHI